MNNIRFQMSKDGEKWYPTPVETFRNGFSVMANNEIEGFHPLVDNLAYNMQYLQFIDKELNELKLSSVLKTMLIKSFVVTGIGIIEGVFSYIIKSNGWWKKDDVEVVFSGRSEGKNSDGETIVIKTEICKKVDPFPIIMTFEDMIICLNRHHKALSIDHLLYPQITRIRDLRNRVHLQKNSGKKDHDYNAFGDKELQEMREILYGVLCSPKVTKADSIDNYNFLKK